MDQELRLKKRGVSGVVVFLLIILFLAAGLAAGWYVGHNNLLPIGKNKETTEKEDKETEKKETKDETKNGTCLNCKENTTYTIQGASQEQLGLLIEVSSKNEKEATIKVNRNKLNWAYNLGWSNVTDSYEEIKKISFDKNIKQIHIGGFGQAVGRETIFYVLEDGTVEYTPVYDDLKNNWNDSDNSKKFNSYGKVKKIENISYLTGMNALAKYSEESYSGYYTTAAVRNDGSFYDLNEILFN